MMNINTRDRNFQCAYIRLVIWIFLIKTQGEKNSNSRKISRKLKDFLPKNSKIRKFWGNFGQNTLYSAKNLPFGTKKRIFFQKLKDFSKTQAQNRPKTQGFGNSTYFQCRKSALKKTLLYSLYSGLFCFEGWSLSVFVMSLYTTYTMSKPNLCNVHCDFGSYLG